MSEAGDGGPHERLVGRLRAKAARHGLVAVSQTSRLLEEAADELDRLRAAMDRALVQISGGLCYFTVEAKHAQLKDAQRTLQEALTPNYK